jgi:hypothetical protein
MPIHTGQEQPCRNDFLLALLTSMAAPLLAPQNFKSIVAAHFSRAFKAN